MYFQIVARQSGGRTKSIINKDETTVLQNIVVPFIQTGVVQENWGKKKISYQVLELGIYGTKTKYDTRVQFRSATLDGQGVRYDEARCQDYTST